MLRLALLLLFISHFSFAQQTSEGQKARLDSLFHGRSDGPGVAVGIVRDGEVVYQHFSGWADKSRGKPITGETTFWIASVSKQFTAMAITVLESQQKLDLDDEVKRYLPELEQFPTIRIRHLLHHSSGLRDGYTLVGMTLRGEKHYDPASVLEMLGKQKELNFQPGTRYEYVNSNYVLLALIVERVARKPFADFMKTDVFLPLGMQDARVYQNDRTASDAVGYVKKNNGYKAVRKYLPAIGSSGVMLSISDAIQMEKQFHHENRDIRLNKMVETAKFNDNSESHYTRGLEKYGIDSTIVFSHFGSDPGFRADILRIPKEQLSVIIFSNASDYWSLGPNLLSAAEIILENKFIVRPPLATNERGALTKLPGAYIDTLSGSAIRFVKIEAGRLKISNSLNGYYADLIQTSEKDFSRHDYYESACSFDGNKLTVTRVDGRRVFIKSDSTSFQESNRHFKGKYYSAELDKNYRIIYKKGYLRLSFYGIVQSKLYPIGENTFYSEFVGGNILRFKTNGDNVTMSFNRDGIKNLRFSQRQ